MYKRQHVAALFHVNPVHRSRPPYRSSAGIIAPDGACATCGNAVPPSDLLILPGPGYDEATGVGSPTPAFLTAPYDANRVGRIAGADRYQTGIQISQQQFPGNGSANAVVLAVGTNFPDALAGFPFGRVRNRVPGKVFPATKLRAPGVDGPNVVPQELSLIAKNCA